MEEVNDIVTEVVGEVEPVRVLTEQLAEIAQGAVALLPSLIVVAIVLTLTALIAWGVRRGIDRAFRNRKRVRNSLRTLFVNLAGILVWFAGLMISAIILFPNLTPSSLVAGLGLGTVAIGFAFKDIFENFLAGIIILFREKMRMNDYIECEGLEGQIEEILIRETHIRRTDGQLVIVPNAMLFKNPLRIVTDLDERRTTIIVGVAYGEDVDEARRVIKNAVEDCDSVIRPRRPIQIFAREFNSSSIDFEVTWWTGSKPVDERRSRDEVVASVKRALDEAGIEIPFPYRTLTFKEPLPVIRPKPEDDDRSSFEEAAE